MLLRYRSLNFIRKNAYGESAGARNGINVREKLCSTLYMSMVMTDVA